MKNFPLAAALLLLSTLSAFAQSEAVHRVDNFDLPNAVRIHTPPPPATTSRRRRGRLVSSTNLNYSPSSVPLTRTTSINWTGTLSGFTTGDSTLDSYILDSGRRNSVDPLLLYAIMHQESTFKPRAMSNKGARGLMQLMPGTALRFGVTSIWDPRQNIEGGTRYMRFLLDTFEGDVELALAGYNAGEGAVIKYGYRVPPYGETQEYVRRISRRYDLIRDPQAFSHANSYSRDQLAANQRRESRPLTMYERSVFAVKLPDGRLQLITQ
ncbi:MAG: lytic transglycosylase domain-containing protein [Acidobacteriota bacterium]|nr:lytic transglycosylase domain-containing protein [Acidobacteriota bacterium]